MITVEPPYYSVLGATVLRDDSDADQFYVLPQSVTLARGARGRPSFTLYKYRRDLTDNPALEPTQARGAGLALFEVEATAPPHDRLASAIADASGRAGARVAPVLFTAATVRAVVAQGEGDRLVTALDVEHGAPLLAPHHAAFTLAATAEGAALLEQAARGGQLPVGIVYQLRFAALRPAVHAHVTMDDETCWNRFSASLGFTYYVSAKIDVELSWLLEKGFVKIEITEFSDDADAERQRQMVMDLVRARVQGDFFKPMLPPGGDGQQAGPVTGLPGSQDAKVTSASALFVLKAKYEVIRERKQFELWLDGKSAVTLVHTVSGHLATLVSGGDDVPTVDVREIDLDDKFFDTLDLRVLGAIDFAALADLTAVTVEVAKGEARRSFPFTPAEQGPYQQSFAIPRAGDDEYEWTAKYTFDADRGGGGATLVAGPFRSRDRVLVINPFEHLLYRRVRFALGPVDPARVPRIAVRARIAGEEGAPDLYQESFDLRADQPEHVLRFHAPAGAAPLRVLAAADWQDGQGGQHAGDEESIPGDEFVVLGPFRDLLTVHVEPAADWTRVTQVLAEVRYRDGDYLCTQLFQFTPRTSAPARWEVPLLAPQRRSYEWRETVLRADGTSAQGPWRTSDAMVLLVGTDRPPQGTLRIVWVGPAGDALGLRVDVFGQRPDGNEEEHSALLQPGGGQQSLALPLDDEGAMRWRYELRKVTASGAALLKAAEGDGDLLVVQSA